MRKRECKMMDRERNKTWRKRNREILFTIKTRGKMKNKREEKRKKERKKERENKKRREESEIVHIQSYRRGEKSKF